MGVGKAKRMREDNVGTVSESGSIDLRRLGIVLGENGRRPGRYAGQRQQRKASRRENRGLPKNRSSP